MEGTEIYVASLKELKSLRKSNTTGKITIDYDALDEKSAAELRMAIAAVLDRRTKAVYTTIFGVQN